MDPADRAPPPFQNRQIGASVKPRLDHSGHRCRLISGAQQARRLGPDAGPCGRSPGFWRRQHGAGDNVDGVEPRRPLIAPRRPGHAVAAADYRPPASALGPQSMVHAPAGGRAASAVVSSRLRSSGSRSRDRSVRGPLVVKYQSRARHDFTIPSAPRPNRGDNGARKYRQGPRRAHQVDGTALILGPEFGMLSKHKLSVWQSITRGENTASAKAQRLEKTVARRVPGRNFTIAQLRSIERGRPAFMSDDGV